MHTHCWEPSRRPAPCCIYHESGCRSKNVRRTSCSGRLREMRRLLVSCRSTMMVVSAPLVYIAAGGCSCLVQDHSGVVAPIKLDIDSCDSPCWPTKLYVADMRCLVAWVNGASNIFPETNPVFLAPGSRHVTLACSAAMLKPQRCCMAVAIPACDILLEVCCCHWRRRCCCYSSNLQLSTSRFRATSNKQPPPPSPFHPQQ